MNGKDIRKARKALGIMWGLHRPLFASELGRALGLAGRDPGWSVLAWEDGRRPISGPVARLLNAYLSGYVPDDLPDIIAQLGRPSHEPER